MRFPRRMEEYIRQPKCPRCGNTDRWVAQDGQRERELAKQTRCYCHRYPFPHRKGALRMCTGHALEGVEPTEDELLDYARVLETPRSDYR